MYSRRTIDDFLAHKSLALVGVSRNGQGFGNAVLKELSRRGYTLRIVHREAATIAGQPSARTLQELAGQVEGVVLVTPPAETSTLVRDAAAAGIRRVWMQQGSESEDAIRFCDDNGLDAVHHECILMFAQPAGFHRFHRGILALFGRLPK